MTLADRDGAAIAGVEKLRFFPLAVVGGQGSYLLGFHGVVNADHFINALGVWTSVAKYLTPPLNPAKKSAQAGKETSVNIEFSAASIAAK